MFLVDLSPSMGASRTVELPVGPEGETRNVEMTKLEWSLQFVKMKIQEMVCPSFSFKSLGTHATRYLTGERRISVALLRSAPRVCLCLQKHAIVCVCRNKQINFEQKPTTSSTTRTEDTNTFQSTFRLGNQMPVHSRNWTSFRHQRPRGIVSSLLFLTYSSTQRHGVPR